MDRYWPLRFQYEAAAISDWTNCPYVAYDYDDHFEEINVPLISFQSGLYGAKQTNITNGIANADFTSIVLPTYGKVDIYSGINTARDVSQPALDWMVNHILKASATPASASITTGQNAVFSVSVSGGTKPYKYQWYEQGTLMAGQTTASITINKMVPGTYTYYCRIMDADATTANSTTSTLTITWPPTPTPTSAPTPTPKPTATPTPTATPSPTPTPSSTVSATTSSGATVELTINGNVTSSQMSNIKIKSNESASTTTMSFSVTGTSGTTGFSNITIPKDAIPYCIAPLIYIDGQLAQDQGYCQDNINYYVWYTTSFSTHEISIVFTIAAPSPSPKPQLILPSEAIYGAAAAVAIVAIAAIVLVSRKAKKVKSKEP